MHHQRKKLRLRDWLKEMIDAGLYGLRWEGDRGKQTFRVPWKHGSRHGWSVKEDAGLFQAWAVYTGKYKEGRDKPDPRKWKTNFRCALNALPDIKEIREKSCPRGKDAYKIYRMRPLKGRDHHASSLPGQPGGIKKTESLQAHRVKGTVFSSLSLTHQPNPFSPFEPWWSTQERRSSISDEDEEIVKMVDDMMSEAGSPYLSPPTGSTDSVAFYCGFSTETGMHPFTFARHPPVDGYD